ncbi:MAG: (2Fe-2S)-binding protein [Candidatus Latescibacteria bacterium]|nr:(2Fe-2S)-binding protein [Candidatus Latescibacterota bacterium]
MKYSLSLTVNDEQYNLLVEASHTLMEVIRDGIGLTGTKCGCEDGRCGTCTVLLDGELVKSCLVLGLQAQGKSVLTIEGLGTPDHLHPLQIAFLEHGAVQCGFCTPGMLLTAKKLLDENPNPTEEDIRHTLVGNLCRCGVYTHATRAILSVARKS